MRRLQVFAVVVLVLGVLASPAFAQQTSNYRWGGLGLAVEPEHDKGYYVIAVTPKSPGEKARIQPGSYIESIDGNDMKKANGLQEWFNRTGSQNPGQFIDLVVVDPRGRTSNVRVTMELMPQTLADQGQWFQREFIPKFRAWRDAMDDADAQRIIATREACAATCNPKKNEILTAFSKPDENWLTWIQAMGFLGKGERKKLEKEFQALMNPKVRRGDTAPVRLYSKMFICFALTAMADPDTDEDVIKAIIEGGETPEMSMAGSQLVFTIFENLGQDVKKNSKKMKKLSDKLIEAEIIPTLGNPVIDENLKGMCRNVQIAAGMSAAQLAQLPPEQRNAVASSRFWVNRAQWHCRALGFICDKLSVSYLLRAKEMHELMKTVAEDGIKRIIPDHAGVASYDPWYKDNTKFLYYDEDNHVWKLSEEAKAAGLSYEEWKKTNK